MTKNDSAEHVIKAWQQIKDPGLRREALNLMAQLQGSSELEQDLNQESLAATQEVKDWEGSPYDQSTHTVLAYDAIDPQLLVKLQDYPCHLIFTSPPYNADVQYDKCNDKLAIEDYTGFLEKSIGICDQLLMPGGRFVFNLRDIAIEKGSRLPIIVPLYDSFCVKRQYKYRGVHIWYKGREESSTGWGSWLSSSNPSIIDLFEYVYVFQKDGEYPDGEDNLQKMEFVENVIGVWKIRPVKKIFGSQKKNVYHHPCPFPAELARRVIKLYSHVGDTVFDPFAGVLTTAIAAADTGRNSVSVELSKKYCNAGLARFRETHGDMFSNASVKILK